MSARVRETSAMFTRQRVLISAGVAGVAVVLIGAVVLLVTRPSATQPVRSGVLGLSTKNGATAPPSPGSSSTPTPTPTPTPTVASNAASAPATTSAATATGTAAGPPACTTVARFATLQVGYLTYRQDQTVQATTTITNNGPTCALTNNTVTANFLASNGATVHTQTVGVTSSSTWASNQKLSTVFSWSPQSQPTGTYTAVVTWPGVRALQQSFTVTSSGQCLASDVSVSMTTLSSFSSGQPVVVNGTLTNTSDHDCVAHATSLIIRDHTGAVVFGAGLGAILSNKPWSSGQQLTFQYIWNQTVCKTNSCVPPPMYGVTFIDSDTGVSTGPLFITLTK
jgi:hypothetical protein